jgi:hypothetical protein
MKARRHAPQKRDACPQGARVKNRSGLERLIAAQACANPKGATLRDAC